MKKYLTILISSILILFTGCQSEIDVDLPEYSPKLVVEGTIENGQPAMVVLSKSIPYFSHIDLNYILNNVVVSNAVVTVTASDGESEQLTFQYAPDAPLYYAYKSSHLVGKTNTSYTLTIQYDGKTYTAKTTIPHTFDLDSIWFDHTDILADTMCPLRMLLTDNAAEDNFYGFSVKVKCPTLHDRLWVHCLPVAFDDQTFNGQTFNYEIARSSPSAFLMPTMSQAEQQNYMRMTFRPGDTVYVKHSMMNHDTYRFMITGGTEAAYGTNPFINPAPVASNIKCDNGEALGAWCGFASKIDTLIWPKQNKFKVKRTKYNL